MPRVAFTMRLLPGNEAEYEARHRPIWPELEMVLRQHGVEDYQIYLDAVTGLVFGHAVVRSLDEWQSITGEEVYQQWWEFMKPLMEARPDGSPAVSMLKEVFSI